MPQPKGVSGNPAGRPAGTKNKVTTDLKKWVEAFVTKNTGMIERDFKKLKPEQRIVLFEKLLRYCVPQRSEVLNEFDKLSDSQIDELYTRIMDNLKIDHDEQE